jgi:flagellar protein FliT
MKDSTMTPTTENNPMSHNVLGFYEAIEQASADMLDAARAGDWNLVVKLEGACVLLISQLKQAARELPLDTDEAKLKSRIMQRILVNDAEVRHLAEPWLHDLERVLQGKATSTLH